MQRINRRQVLGGMGLFALDACRRAAAQGRPGAGLVRADGSAFVDASDDAARAAVTAADDAGAANVASGDAGAVRPQDQDFPEWYLGNSSESTDTVLMFRGNLRRNFGGTGPLSADLEVKWRYRLGVFEAHQPDGRVRFWEGTGWTGQAIKWGRHVYVGGVDAKFYCFHSETGALRWQIDGGRMFKSSPCFYRGKIYVGNVDDYLRCIDARTGRVLWRFNTGRDCDSSPCVVDNVVYVGGEAGFVTALDPDTGRVLWRRFLGGQEGPGGSQGIESSPAIDNDEIYVGTFDEYLYSLNRRDGSIRWRFQTGGDTDATTPLTDRYVYACAEEENPSLFCVDRATGQRVWEFNRNRGGWWSTPAIVGDRLYVGGNNARFYCLDANTGREVWSFRANEPIWSSPAVVDGKVVFGSYDSMLYMLDASDGRELWRHNMGGRCISTACIVDGRIYVGSAGGYFMCFGPRGR